MKKLLALSLILIIFLSGCGTKSAKPDESSSTPAQKIEASGWEADGELKILTVGNSFSDDSMQYVYDIAKAAGIEKISLGNLYIPSCTIDMHLSNSRDKSAAYEFRTNTTGVWNTKKDATLLEGIEAENWDFISFQQQSGNSGIVSSYKNLNSLLSYVRRYKERSEFVWNMTWAYQSDYENTNFAKYSNDQTKMFEAITSAVQSQILSNQEIKKVIPTGTSIQNARTSYIGDTLSRDGLHLTKDLGRYIAGLTFVKTLTGKNIDDISFAPSGVDDNMKAVAIESVNNAVSNPFAVTQSKYIQAP